MGWIGPFDQEILAVMKMEMKGWRDCLMAHPE
jgi:hypothetical protein